MNCEVIDALHRLLFNHGQNVIAAKILDIATDDHRVDRNRPNGDGRVSDNRLSTRIEIPARG